MKSNTKLTDVEIRWIKNVYKRGKFGRQIITRRINEGREKANIDLISDHVVRNAIKKIAEGGTFAPSNVHINKKIMCPKCGHIWNITKK